MRVGDASGGPLNRKGITARPSVLPRQRSMASSCRWVVSVYSTCGSSKTSESRKPPDTTGVEGLRTTPFFGLAPDPDAERLDSDAECRKNTGEEPHSHFNYGRDTLRCRQHLVGGLFVGRPRNR